MLRVENIIDQPKKLARGFLDIACVAPITRRVHSAEQFLRQNFRKPDDRVQWDTKVMTEFRGVQRA